MQGIEFEKETYHPLHSQIVAQQQPKKSLLMRLVIKISGGRIKDDSQVLFILLVVAVILIAISIYNFVSTAKSNQIPTQAEIDQARIKILEHARGDTIKNDQ